MEAIIAKIVKYLENTGWDTILAHYWISDEFKKIIQTLQDDVENGKRFVPAIKNMLKWMKECPYESVRVMLFISDTGNQLNHQGIPFSQDMMMMSKLEAAVSEKFKYKDKEIRVCNRYDIKEFLRGLIPDDKVFDYDLKRWCKQGVLMVPYALTCRLDGKPHYNLYNDFRARIIDVLNVRYTDLPVVLVGDKWHSYEDNINSRYVLPMSVFPYCSNTKWHQWVNEQLTNKNQEVIKWS